MATYSTDEGADRCPVYSCPAPKVEDDEALALVVYHPLLCDEFGKPKVSAFEIKKMLVQSDDTAQYPHDCCGHSEGVSLVRTSGIDNAQIMQQSVELASGKKDPQTPMGGATALTRAVRSIRLDKAIRSTAKDKVEISDVEQIAFVLTDGGQLNPHHAVLRLHAQADRTIAKEVRGKLVRLFQPDSAFQSNRATAPP